MKTVLLALLRAYQLCISPYLGSNCRFYPSCSHYAREAIGRHGVGAGSALAVRRLCKCHPWHTGGVDLVPEPTNSKVSTDSSSAALSSASARGCSHN